MYGTNLYTTMKATGTFSDAAECAGTVHVIMYIGVEYQYSSH